MSEYTRQKERKPSIDDMITSMLRGEKLKRAAAFVSFVREHKMSPQWGATNSYNVSYKGRRVCIIKIDNDHFEVRANTQYTEAFNAQFNDEADEIKEFLLNNVTFCFACGTCKPGIDITLLGKPLKNACYNPVVRFENPDDEQLRLIEKLVLFRKTAITEGTAPKITYISIKKR